MDFWKLHCYFHAATCSGHLQALKAGNAHSLNAFTSRFFPFSALELACAFGNVEAVRMLLAGENAMSVGVNLQSPKTGWTPMQWAVAFGRVEVVKVLVERGAAPVAGLAEFVLWASGGSTVREQLLSALKKNDRFDAVTGQVQAVLAAENAIIPSGEQVLKIDLAAFSLEHMIPMTVENKIMLSSKLIAEGSVEELYWIHNSASKSSFTLPMAANLMLLGARYEWCLGEEPFCSFVEAGMRELCCKQDSCEELSEMLFWFGNVVQFCLWLRLDKAIDCSKMHEFHLAMQKELNLQWEKLIQAICNELGGIAEGALVAFDPQATDGCTEEKPISASRKQILKMGLMRIADKLHLWNPQQQSQSEPRKESPATLVAFLSQVHSLAKVHFNPLNAVVEAKICTLLLKEVLSFCNRHALQCIMHNRALYCNKTSGMSIRMNVSEVEFWLQETFFTTDPKGHAFLQASFAPLSCICQYLQIWSGEDDFVEFCEEHEMHQELLWEMQNNFSLQPIPPSLEVDDLVDLKERFLVTRQLHSLFYPKQ